MQANQTKVQAILDGARQYVVPMFQRPYSWGQTQWDALWQDLAELCEEDAPRNHFIGSLVTMPAKMRPEGVTKFILIDGQQRLTTLSVVLAVLRDQARKQPGNLAVKIDEQLLTNRHEEGTDVYKLLPTQADRATFQAIIDGSRPPKDAPLARAYEYFERKLRLTPEVGLEKLSAVIRNQLILVSIVLDANDNPHLIFESLNAKGRPLTQADLIRNFFFMRIEGRYQEKAYADHWKPMQDRLGDGDNLTEFIRHYLMRDGKIVRKGDVYLTLKESVERRGDDAAGYLKDVAEFSGHYLKLLQPQDEANLLIRERTARLNRYEATTAYPFLLSVYDDYARKRIPAADFAAVLDLLESFLIRRFICGVATSGLTKIFPALYDLAAGAASLVEGVRQALRDKGFPRDQQFKDRFVTAKIYGGDRSAKARLILERLEMSFEHKEPVDPGGLTIEHVMPRTASDWWRQHLGEEWEADHAELLDTAGNLTLTGYNSELSNSDFPTKKALLLQSHVELNGYFAGVEAWDAQAITRRGEALAERAVRIWPDIAGGGDGVELVPDEDEAREDVKLLIAEVVERFGGERERLGKGGRYIARTADGKVINIKYSKRHSDYYWFGFHASLWADVVKAGVTHIVFLLLPDEFVTVPVDVMKEYLADAGSSPKTDGSIRHYHVLISVGSKPELFHHGKAGRVSLLPYRQKFG